ncbi:MAG TPA: tetratricopeptide repeat protein [Candidatus Angelobacter sp.]|nr:tetratricopeptide repeat protein [Candidatus Angelobacter sp.]
MKTRPISLLALALFFCNVYSIAQIPTQGGGSAAAFSHSPFDSPGHQSSIAGTVQDISNTPMNNVRVELTDGNGVVVNSAYTNAAGNFEFFGVEPGTYNLVATAGLVQNTERVEVNSFAKAVVLHLVTNNKPQDGVQGNSISVAQYKIPNKARDEYRKARAAMEKDKLDQAHEHLEKALAIYPNYADALTFRGVLELNQKNSQAAVADLDKAIKADPNFPMAYLVMGSALNMQSKFDDAIRALERGESLAPDSWQAHFELAKAYIGKADYQSALKHLQQAQNMEPTKYPLIYLLQADALLAMKQYPEAMNALQSYLQKEPQGPNSAEAHRLMEKAQAFMSQSKGQ